MLYVTSLAKHHYDKFNKVACPKMAAVILLVDALAVGGTDGSFKLADFEQAYGWTAVSICCCP